MSIKLKKIDKDYTDNFDGLEEVSSGQKELLDDTTGLLYSILKELKIMNIHLSLITDTNITKEEVE